MGNAGLMGPPGVSTCHQAYGNSSNGKNNNDRNSSNNNDNKGGTRMRKTAC